MYRKYCEKIWRNQKKWQDRGPGATALALIYGTFFVLFYGISVRWLIIEDETLGMQS